MSSMCRLGIESPFVPLGAGYTEFSSELVKELEGTTKKEDNILKQECRDLFSVAATRVFIQLILRNPPFGFEEVIGPVPVDSCVDLAAAVVSHVRMLLEKFSCNDNNGPDEEPPPCLEINYPYLGEASCNTFIVWNNLNYVITIFDS
ncbi:hypothetical protein D1007_56696 [Hordeum vulgare]|nr:hypothetical protein D1007_56696 [Hordeum vulgare]